MEGRAVVAELLEDDNARIPVYQILGAENTAGLRSQIPAVSRKALEGLPRHRFGSIHEQLAQIIQTGCLPLHLEPNHRMRQTL